MVFLNLVEALPIQSCASVDSCVPFLHIICIPDSISFMILRHYNSNVISNFDQHFIYSIDVPVHYENITSTR